MSKPKYKLTYFNGRGRAEAMRMVFAQAGVEYIDERVTQEQWAKMKPNLPYGLPALEVDGEVYFQSYAILAFLTREFGLCGENNKEQLRIDMVNFCMQDMLEKMPFFEKDEDKKKALVKELFDVKLPPLLKKLEDILGQNDCGAKFFTSKLSHADIGWMLTAEALQMFNADALSATPKLAALAKRVAEQPKIKEWIAKRPDTPF